MSVKLNKKNGGMTIIGSGSGGKSSSSSSRTPVESPDSLHNNSYAAILDIVSNGEISGPANPNNPLKDIYLDGTPIQNEDGSLNFESVEVDYRVGTVDQDHISGFPASSSTTSVDYEVDENQPWVQSITNSELSAVRVSVYTPTLLRTYDSGDNAGDRVGYEIPYAIDLATDGGSFVNILESSIDGKTVNGYTRTHRIELDSGSSWTVRVRRLNAASEDSLIEDSFYVSQYAEVLDGKFRFPMSAMVGIKIDAEQFSSIPTRSYNFKGVVINVPSNYDPIDRTYTGTWDGTFKRAWSNNPAWVYYDMVTSNLYGLGEYIDASMVDRYSLYQIGVYCDQLVDDGYGGQEPRFVCNAYLQSQEDALQVLNDLLSIFRGMAYWAGGLVIPVADMPSDPVYTYTNGNVVNGRFEYAGADLSTRKTVALVSWNDPTDFYRSKVEAVEDDDGIARYGIRKTDVIAFGCTSRGQAQRAGLYMLYTSRMEGEAITFTVGLDGVIPQPGSVVRIADRNRAGRRLGGRIAEAGEDYIITDAENPAKIGDTVSVNLPCGASESHIVESIEENKIYIDSQFSETPAVASVWSIDADDLVTQLVKVVSIKEESDITFTITGMFHHPDKYAAIDDGVRLDPLPVTVVPPRTQSAPSNIEIKEFYSFHQGQTRHWAEISWDAPDYAIWYNIQWKRDNGDWVSLSRTGSKLAEILDIYSGLYTVRVRALNSLEVPSLWAYSDPTQLEGSVTAPPQLTGLFTTSKVLAIDVRWSYPSSANIISAVELRASNTNNFNDSYTVTEASYPSTNFTVYGLSYGTERWFWARPIDKNGNYGDWYPASTSNGIYGVSSSDSDEILSYLEGQISEGQLSQDLIEQIDNTAMNERIDELTVVVDENNEARIEDITAINSTVGDLSADVEQTSQTVAELDGELSSSWQVKTQVRNDGRVVQAGVAIGASINPDGTSRSEALFMADTVAFLNTLNGKLHAPFIFDVANDTAILNSAIIGDATIQTAKIANSAITNAKIGNIIQSNNWSWNAGNFTGWQINKNGNIYAQNGIFKGAVYADAIVGPVNSGVVFDPPLPYNQFQTWNNGTILEYTFNNSNGKACFLAISSPTFRAPGSSVSQAMTFTTYINNTEYQSSRLEVPDEAGGSFIMSIPEMYIPVSSGQIVNFKMVKTGNEFIVKFLSPKMSIKLIQNDNRFS